MMITAASGMTWVLRALRLKVLFATLSFKGALRVSATHNALTRLLPARSGELSLPVTLNREGGVTLGEGALAMVGLRLLEVLSLLCLVGWASLDSSVSELVPTSWIITGVMLSAITLLSLRRLFKLALHHFGSRLSESWQKSLSVSSTLSHLRALGTCVLTLLILCSQAALFWALLTAGGGSISYGDTLIGSFGVHLAGVLPAPTIGNVGTHELGWIVVYTQLGVSHPAAGVSALLSQWLTLILALMWWGGSQVFCPRRTI